MRKLQHPRVCTDVLDAKYLTRHSGFISRAKRLVILVHLFPPYPPLRLSEITFVSAIELFRMPREMVKGKGDVRPMIGRTSRYEFWLRCAKHFCASSSVARGEDILSVHDANIICKRCLLALRMNERQVAVFMQGFESCRLLLGSSCRGA